MREPRGSGHVVSPDGEYTWHNFPFGTAWWSVSVNARFSWIGNTSTQNFFHFNNVPGKRHVEAERFQYKKGARNLAQLRDLTIFYEITDDYTIDLNEYFSELSFLPAATCGVCLWQRTDEQRNILIDHFNSFGPIRSEFIELVNGVLTLKKGYRWDGTSSPFVGEESVVDIRSSGVHDTIYDLMRLGYLSSGRTRP